MGSIRALLSKKIRKVPERIIDTPNTLPVDFNSHIPYIISSLDNIMSSGMTVSYNFFDTNFDTSLPHGHKEHPKKKIITFGR